MNDVQGEFDQTNAEMAITPSGEAIQQWIHDEQARLDSGLPISQRGIPPGYKVSNGQIVKTNWWDDWGKGAAIGMGLGVAGGALFGAPAAGAASGAAATAPTVSGAAGTLPAHGFIGYGATVPAAASPGIFGGGAAAGAAGAAGGGVAAKSALDRVISAAKPVVAGTAAVGALTQGPGGGGGTSGQLPPELQQYLDLQRQRVQGQNPLFQAVTQLAYDRMPTNATRGLPPDAITQAMQALTKGR